MGSSSGRPWRLASRWRRQRRISLVINTCDRRERLAQALASLSRQTYRRFEIVVVNGPSQDGTEQLLRGYAGRVKLGRCDVRCLGVSRNLGVALSAGEIVAFLDDDAIPEPDWLERLAAAYDDPAIMAAGGFVFDVPLDRIEYRICTCTRLGEACTDAPGPAARYQGRGADPFLYLAGCNMSFRRSALVAAGGFNADFIYGYDDAEICCRILDAGGRIALLEDAIVRHHRAANAIRDDSQTIRDIYPFVQARAVFALQNAGTDQAAVTASLHSFAQDWRNHANATLTGPQCERFLARIEQGLQDGIAAGTLSRKYQRFGRAPRFKKAVLF